MARVYLKSKIKNRVENGHPWVYKNEIKKIEGSYEPGDIVEVYNHRSNFIGRGYINPRSLITVRILTRDLNEKINENFFENRIKRAWEYRKKVVDVNSCRVIFAEADGLPGLVVDKFNEYLVLQILTLGMEKFKDIIVKVLDKIIQPEGIYERNDVSVRRLEGLPESKGFLKGEFTPLTVIEENGVKILVDIENGQKTGYFLDQRDNRLAIKRIVEGARVLDCFCHTGSFALHAAKFGASLVEAVDISEQAIATARKNAELNGFEEKINFVCANAFDLLRDYENEGRKFDVIILDPPAFAKSAKKVDNAFRGYKEINLRALKLLQPGGFLVSASCSHYMYPDLFRRMLWEASLDAGRELREVEYRTQSPDHPYMWNFKESLYLKFFILNIF